MRIVKTFLLVILLTTIKHSFSQSTTDPLSIPKMAPPSPDAAGLGRYGEFPVSLSTGTPEVSLPLFEINTGHQKLPITINYHASGIRVNDESSRVGLGWSLEAGGNISRVAKGLPDDQGNGYYGNGIPVNSNTDAYRCFGANLYFYNNVDGQPDDYYFNFNKKSGKFLWTNKLQTGVAPVAVTVPYSLMKIALGSNQFTLTDDDGSVYVFGTSLSSQRAYEVTNAQTDGGATFGGGATFSSNWYLTEMISPDKGDTIKFIYEGPDLIVGPAFYSTHLTRIYNDNGNPGQTLYNWPYSVSQNYIETMQLKQILFRNGKVIFDYDSSRLDNNSSILNAMHIYQQNGTSYSEIKRFSFYHSYFNGVNIAPQRADLDITAHLKRLRLDSVKQSDATGLLMPPYILSYSTKQLPQIGSYAQDYWGFYNGASNQYLLIYNSDGVHDPSTTYGANRSSNGNFMDAGMLNKITYPTGGYTTFDFEPNQLGSTVVGGLRIKRINSYDNTGIRAFSKKYNYLQASSSSNLFNGDLGAYGVFLKYTSTVGYSSGSHIYYRDVDTYVENYSFPIGSASGAAVSYGTVEEMYDSTIGTNGKNVYTYVIGGNYTSPLTPSISYFDWRGGELLCQRQYKETSPNNYLQIKSTTNTYTYNDRTAFPITYYGVKANTITQYIYGALPGPPYPGCTFIDGGNILATNTIGQLEGNDYLTKTVDSTFDQNGANPLVTSIDYFFDNPANINPIRIQMTDSKGNLLKTLHRTVLEKTDINNASPLSTVASAAIDSLVSKNILNNLIDFEKYNGSNFLSRQRINYKVWNPNLIAESDLQTQTLSASMDKRLQYNSYDSKGNPTSISKPGDASTSYIWGYNNQYLIAEIKNASIQDTIVNTPFSYPMVSNQIIVTSPMKEIGVFVINYAQTLGLTGIVTRVSGQASNITSFRIVVTNTDLNTQVFNKSYSPTQSISESISITTPGNYDVNYIYTVGDPNQAPVVSLTLTANYSNQKVRHNVFHTSFEEDISNINNLDFVTGSKSHTGTYNVVLPGYNGNYIISYWQKSLGGTWTYNSQIVTVTSASMSDIVIGSSTSLIDEVRLYPQGAQMSTYTYSPLIGVTSVTDLNNKVTYYEYDNFQRLKNIKDDQGNIIKNFQYNYAGKCGTNCSILPMQTFNGTNTISYPVGVFNVNGKLLGNATNQAQYLSLWNTDTADQHRGTLAAGLDSMHFNLTLISNATVPFAVVGCRYYQYDLPYNKIDGIRNTNCAYIDFGDGSGMLMGKNPADTPSVIAPNTTYVVNGKYLYFIHSYPDSTSRTLTFYHNDASETMGLDNAVSPANSLIRLRNLRGNFPQNMIDFAFSSYQQSSALTVANITDWNSINTIVNFNMNNGDNLNPSKNVSYAQDFMSNNTGLKTIYTARYGPMRTGYRDTTFRLNRLKSNWNTYFIHLQQIVINDDHWNREDLSALKELNTFGLSGTTQNHQDDPNSPLIPIPSQTIDNILNQIAAGAGQTVSNGVVSVGIGNGGSGRTSASDVSVTFLKSKGWLVVVNGVTQ